MNTTTTTSSTITSAMPASTIADNTVLAALDHLGRPSSTRRFFGVVRSSQTYRNLAYLLLGLPLGTAWFVALVTAVSVGISTLVVALAGIPILIGAWFATRLFANIERRAANTLLGLDLPLAPHAGAGGNLWVRLRSMCSDRDRWRELGYVLLRFPVGVATFTATLVLPAVAASIAYAPFYARLDDGHSFGSWTVGDTHISARFEHFASTSPWAWVMVPVGALVFFAAFHALNGIAKLCGAWAKAQLCTSWATAA